MSLSQVEAWRPIDGLPYEVSDHGTVRSLGFLVRAHHGHAYRPGRVLRQAKKSNGYLQVTLCASDGSRRSAQVHQLVCEAFHGPRPSADHQVCHWNGDRTDNFSGNLRWGTAVDNAADRYRHGNFVCNLPSLAGYVF